VVVCFFLYYRAGKLRQSVLSPFLRLCCQERPLSMKR
jgi:hypothetical protein